MTRIPIVALLAREPGLAVNPALELVTDFGSFRPLRAAYAEHVQRALVPLYAPLAQLAIGSVLAGQAIA